MSHRSIGNEIAAYFLNCKKDEIKALDTVLIPVDEIFDDLTDKTFDGVCEKILNISVKALQAGYDLAKSIIKRNPNAYIDALDWEPDLLLSAIEFLNPQNDLHYYISGNNEYVLELDYWDLYSSILDEVCDDFPFRDFIENYCDEIYGGERVPEKFDPILL